MPGVAGEKTRVGWEDHFNARVQPFKPEVRVEEELVSIPYKYTLTCSHANAEVSTHRHTHTRIGTPRARVTPGTWNAACVWEEQLTH